MSASDDSTRPLSVAELLAKNGTIGSPPVGGRRRKRRRNSDGVSVAELTGEIPVIRPGEIPVAVGEETEEYLDETTDEVSFEEGDEVYQDVTAEEAATGIADAEAIYEEDAGQLVVESSETVVVYTSAEVPEYESEYTEYAEYTEFASAEVPVDVAEESGAIETEVEGDVGAEVEADTGAEIESEIESDAEEDIDANVEDAIEDAVEGEAAAVEVESPPLAGDPVPHRSTGPERGYDPRPVRRSSGAEQMAYDPVDESVNLDDLVVEDVEQLRSYLRTSPDTLFSGGTVADDMARRGVDAADRSATEQTAATVSGPARPRNVGSALWNSVLAVVQSLMAVVFGAALFIGFDQLWRWNNLVALILSVLVVLTLAAGVRYVRKTEDIVSTLTAVAVGLLVTLGPLALQST